MLISTFPSKQDGGGVDPTKHTVIISVSASDGGSISGQIVTVNGADHPLSGTKDSVSIIAEVGSVLNISFNDRLSYYKPAPITYTVMQSVVVKLFDVQYRKGMILGIEYDETDSNPALSRTYDAYGKVANVASSLTAVVRNDFDSLYPFSGIIKEVVNGKRMIKIPKFYYKFSKEGNIVSKSISGTKIDPTWKIHPMFLKGNVQWTGANPETDFNEFCWVAQYETINDNGSAIGYYPTVSKTRAQFRTLASQIGNGWSQLGVAEWMGLQLLLEIVFATHNSESVMPGNQSGSVRSTGLTSGAVSSCVQISNTDMSFYGIENMVGNVLKLVDGLNINGDKAYINTDITKYADDVAVGIEASVSSVSGYIKTMSHDERITLDWVQLPASVGGSKTTFFCDYLWGASGWRVAVCGAYWNVNPFYGLWSWHLDYDSSHFDTNLGSRLSYRPF